MRFRIRCFVLMMACVPGSLIANEKGPRIERDETDDTAPKYKITVSPASDRYRRSGTAFCVAT